MNRDIAMIPICLISKLMGKKLIYIESFAKVTSPTETGKLLYKFADQFYVQWKPMLKFYPKGYNEKYFKDKGALIEAAYPRCSYLLAILQSVRNSKVNL